MLGSDRTILIVDDSPAVWPHDSSRLLIPRRYFFFPGPGWRTHPGHLLQHTDESAEHGQLARLLHVLRDIHAHFFEHVPPQLLTADHCPSVSESVAAIRKKVLNGAVILFSHVIPLHKQNSPASNAAWQLATELGARIAPDVGPSVTHVVAGANNTPKVHWAKKSGVPVVSLDWLHASSYMWERADERVYPVLEQVASMELDQTGVLPPPQIQA